MERAIGHRCLATLLLTAALGEAPALALSASQRSGDAGPSVVRLQRQLQTLNSYGGPLSGQFDQATAAALAAFQRSRGLYTKGAVDIATKQALLDATGQNLALVANLQPGDRGPSTAELQRLLNQLGFLAAEPTGYFDGATRRALEGFQRSRGLSPTGNVDLATMQALRDRGGTASGQIPQAQPNRPTAQPLVASGGLQPGERSAAVRRLQTQLQQLGFFKTTPTGFYGPITTRAVRSFQSAVGLSPTGRATAETLRAIDNRLASRPATFQPVEARPQATAPDRFTMRYLGRTYQPLKRGDSGDRVKLLQDRLRDLGFLNRRSTGYYGDVTQAAVEAFQRSRRIPATGTATAATQRALFGAPASPNAVSRSFAPAAIPTQVGRLPRSDDRWLMPGDRGARVTALQKRLADLGLLGFDRITGVYDNPTAQAVISFQRSRRLSPTGIADLVTQRAMGLL